MKVIISVLIGIMSILALIGSAIAVNISGATLVILSILKLTALLDIAWFAGIGTLSAVGTPLFMVVIGLFLVVLNIILLAVIAEANKLK